MKTNVRWLSIVLALCLIVSGVMVVSAAAGDIPEASLDGVRVSLVTPKDAFDVNEQIDVMLTVTNDSGAKLQNVSSAITIPADLILKEGTLAQRWDQVNASAMVQNSVKLEAKNTTVPTETTVAPTTEPTTETTTETTTGATEGTTGGGGTNTPTTGDNALLPLYVLVMVASAAGLGFLLVTGKLKIGKSFCWILLAATMVVSMAPNALAATDAQQLQVSKTVTVNGQAMTISASVSYETVEESDVLTRADLEAALAEVAWDYYVKGDMVQYDSMDLNTRMDGQNQPISKYFGGFWRTTTISTLEDADSDTALFTVCSDYCWNVYYEALGYPILGNRLNCHTSQYWRGTESPDDMVILRWHNQGKGTILSDYDDDYGMTFEDWYEHADMVEFFKNWEENLRPGDIITQRKGNSAHAVLYVGNGIILHSNGEGKYNMVKGTDKPEVNGSITFTYLEDYYFPEGRIFNLDAMVNPASQNWICVIRPLDLLTKDDSDNDPSNDVLDETYVLDIGKLNAQLPQDPRELQTSGYTIKDTTYTRMAYPAMNIDRTVDITPYGTVVKGDTLTYTISISNESNDPKYVIYHSYGKDTTYAGKAYEDLWVVEQVPENTVLVSAPGASVEGNTLRWEVDIPVGETAVLTYTVRATGEIGQQIVSEGGYVANIPSNSITNVIGGEKLNADALAAMQSFAEAGKSGWNSNDGYKISASKTAGTSFAERVYNETTGLDLQLPEMQELVDILFNYEKIFVEDGLYLAHDSSGLNRYMYTLNETTTDPANQIYRDMVINGYFGGVWVYSNDYALEPRIYEFRMDYMEPGDIVLYMNLTESLSGGAVSEERKVEEWRVVVYLGNGSFASLNSVGQLDRIDDTSAIMPAFTYDMFVALRPSQAYANIHTDVAAFTGPAPDLTEEDKAWGYEPQVSDVKLNNEKSAELAALTADGFTKYLAEFIGEVYSKIGIDVVTNGTMNSSYATIVKSIFDDIPSDSEAYLEYGHEYYLVEMPPVGTENAYDMLLYYGGPSFGAGKLVSSLADLHPGDAVLLSRRDGNMDVCAVYQGEGKFLVNIRDLDGNYYGTPDYRQWKTLSFASDAEFLAWLSGPIVSGNSDCFEGYLILRPSRVFDDINNQLIVGSGNGGNTDDGEISSKRSITDRVLNNAEKKLLSSLLVSDWVAAEKPTNLKKIPAWIYGEKLNVTDIATYFDQTMFYLRNGLFHKNGSWYFLSDSSNSNYVEKYHQMLVSDCFGGFNFESSQILKEKDFEIGDLFCAWTVDETGQNIYWVGLYQGDYRFLLIRNRGGSNPFAVGEEDYLMELNARISNGEFAYFFILRPDQLAGSAKLRDINDGPLTNEEITDLASLSCEDWLDGGKKTNNSAANWFYSEAGVDISGNFDKSLFNMMYAIFDEVDWLPYAPDEAAYQEKYSKMLVDGYYGGGKFGNTGKTFTAADFEVGDLFCAYTEEIVDGAKKRAYYLGLYQGNGKFLMTQTGYNITTDCYVDTEKVYAADIANTYMCYYVLRPNQLNDTETVVPTDPRDIATGILTEAEKAALSGITVADYETAAASSTITNLKGFATWVYEQAYVDVSGYIDQSVFNMMYMMFSETDWTPYTEEDTQYATYEKYCKMLVDGYYGGGKFGNTGKTFTADDFRVGDLFCAYTEVVVDGSKLRTYYVGLYQGNGQFLMLDNVDGWKCSVNTEIPFASDIANTYMCYYVLRPEQLAQSGEPGEGGDSGDTGTEEPTTPRDIATGVLTETEKAAISALTLEAYEAAGKPGNLNKLAEWAYGEANVDVTAYVNKSVFNMMKGIFSGDAASGRTLILEGESGYNANYSKMLVDGYYGGTEVLTQDKTFTEADFKVGDLFCAVTYQTEGSDAKYYYAGLYLGNGQFLMTDNIDSWKGEIGTGMVFSPTLADDVAIYFVLRPEQLAQTEEPGEGGETGGTETNTGLTEDQKSKLAAITVADYEAAAAESTITNLKGFGQWVYHWAGMDVSGCVDNSVFNMAGNNLFDKTTTPWAVKTGDTVYLQMLVEGCYGGKTFANSKLFTAADFEIGDLFCAYTQDTVNGSTVRYYYIGLYQGSGQFLMLDNLNGWACSVDTTTAFAADIATTFQCYYVLRPGLVIGES